MTSISTLGSYTIADAQSDQTWRVSRNQTGLQNSTDDPSATSTPTIQRASVSLSQEGLARLQAFADAQKAGSASTHRVSAGTPILDPNALTDAEHTALMESLAPKSPQARLDGYLQSLEVQSSNLRSAYQQMDSTFSSFLNKLGNDHADLKGVSFGFTVTADKKLVVTQADGLDSEQLRRLETALNGSKDLVEQANQLADAQIAMFAAYGASSIDFSRDTYAKTIDLGAELMARHNVSGYERARAPIELARENMRLNWLQQVTANGVRTA